VVFGGSLDQGVVHKPVTLIASSSGTNTLQVELAGGGSVTISITGYSYKFAADYGQAVNIAIPPPDDIDWRAKGAVTPVKNEGSCQADWAFSATGVVEGGIQVTTGILPDLSEQQLLDCTPHVTKCSDSSPVRALLYLLGASDNGGGADTETTYPYTGKITSCRAGSITGAHNVTSVTILPPGETILDAQIERQPVSAVINGNWFSTAPHSGVVDPVECGTKPPEYRAVLVVGVVTGGIPAWIVKNSLGTSWGQAGYVQLPKDKNVCGIGNYLSVAQ